MMAALRYVDDFQPVHNLESLEQLAERLRQLRNPRTRSRQPMPALQGTVR